MKKQLILATAIPEPTFTASATDNGDEDEDRTRIVIFELRIPEQVQCDDIGLDIIIDSCIFAKQGTLSWQMISGKTSLYSYLESPLDRGLTQRSSSYCT